MEKYFKMLSSIQNITAILKNVTISASIIYLIYKLECGKFFRQYQYLPGIFEDYTSQNNDIIPNNNHLATEYTNEGPSKSTDIYYPGSMKEEHTNIKNINDTNYKNVDDMSDIKSDDQDNEIFTTVNQDDLKEFINNKSIENIISLVKSSDIVKLIPDNNIDNLNQILPGIIEYVNSGGNINDLIANKI